MSTSETSSRSVPEYQIRTLQDIFSLPTVEAMKRCLDELSEMMVSARAMSELLGHTAKNLAEQDGKKLPDGFMAMQWPEVTTWRDDGGIANSEIGFHIDGENEPLLTLKYSKEGRK